MQHDESGTLARLKTLRAEFFDPGVARFGGRIFKNTSDGALAEFVGQLNDYQAGSRDALTQSHIEITIGSSNPK